MKGQYFYSRQPTRSGRFAPDTPLGETVWPEPPLRQTVHPTPRRDLGRTGVVVVEAGGDPRAGVLGGAPEAAPRLAEGLGGAGPGVAVPALVVRHERGAFLGRGGSQQGGDQQEHCRAENQSNKIVHNQSILINFRQGRISKFS